ncbi:polyketide synthase [Nannochloropsis gaditana]|uniref:Polyketide synthase n=1 Tax=Nannochloropsis gaditana TaxID=72520 RepID=W7SYG6_9STRA|nr:polyketide synthase [Nannochloropsis gaditana]
MLSFFGIAGPEVASMDPQQRLLLEVAFESFVRAGMTKTSLLQSMTGVFVGIGSSDWISHSRSKATPYTGTGVAASIAANRVSYVLGLKGPSMSIDTACSSSLVALDAASEKLRRWKCDAAMPGARRLMRTRTAMFVVRGAVQWC